MRELLKLAAVLTIICCGASLALALVYNYTKDPIAHQQYLKKMRAVKAVFPRNEGAGDLKTEEIPFCEEGRQEKDCRTLYLITKDGSLTGTAFEVSVPGYGGPILIMLGITKNSDVSGIKIIAHTETPGLGANITKDFFQNQFAGMDLTETTLSLVKDGGSVDHVSGATISSVAVTQAVKEGLEFYNDHRTEIASRIKDS